MAQTKNIGAVGGLGSSGNPQKGKPSAGNSIKIAASIERGYQSATSFQFDKVPFDLGSNAKLPYEVVVTSSGMWLINFTGVFDSLDLVPANVKFWLEASSNAREKVLTHKSTVTDNTLVTLTAVLKLNRGHSISAWVESIDGLEITNVYADENKSGLISLTAVQL